MTCLIFHLRYIARNLFLDVPGNGSIKYLEYNEVFV